MEGVKKQTHRIACKDFCDGFIDENNDIVAAAKSNEIPAGAAASQLKTLREMVESDYMICRRCTDETIKIILDCEQTLAK